MHQKPVVKTTRRRGEAGFDSPKPLAETPESPVGGSSFDPPRDIAGRPLQPPADRKDNISSAGSRFGAPKQFGLAKVEPSRKDWR